MSRKPSHSPHTEHRRDRRRSPSRGGTGEHPPRYGNTTNATTPVRPNPRTRQRLSQNLLTDHAVAAAIVRYADVGRQESVIEVGPGEGILTRALARNGNRITAYELDPRYAKRLAATYRNNPDVTCHHRDFLTVTPPSEAFSVVANIPYSRTNAIVGWCLDASAMTSATLVTQWEYARKRTGDYGRWSRLTVLSWPRHEWRLLGRIDRRRFRPVPRVDSGILRIERRDEPLLSPRLYRLYEELVMAGFIGTGGDLHHSLRGMARASRLRKALAQADIHPGVPVGYIRPGQWVRLARALGR